MSIERISIASADWKDTAGLIESFKIALEEHGIRVTDFTDDWGSDDFICAITKMSDPEPTFDELREAMGWEDRDEDA